VSSGFGLYILQCIFELFQHIEIKAITGSGPRHFPLDEPSRLQAFKMLAYRRLRQRQCVDNVAADASIFRSQKTDDLDPRRMPQSLARKRKSIGIELIVRRIQSASTGLYNI
jgi:hypothetical protein